MPSTATLDSLLQNAPTLSVGILTADLLALGSELALLERTGVQLVHIDVMDGVFVPQLTVGPAFVRAVKGALLKDVHLMVGDPVEKIGDYIRAGADILTVHYEAGPHVHRVLQSMGGCANANDPVRGLVRGLALNPGTPVGVTEPLLDEIDLLLLLAVNPGWGGQSFIESTRRKIARAREMIRASGRPILLAVDGGVTLRNFEGIAATGVDVIVTGSAVFDGKAAEQNAGAMLRHLNTRPRRADTASIPSSTGGLTVTPPL